MRQFRRYLSESAVLTPRDTTLRLSLYEKSRGRFGCAWPPPTQSGERIEPWRERPVPFCGRGLRPPPRTSDRCFVLLVPCRMHARCHVTTRWTMSVRSGIAHTSERSLAMPARGSSHDESHACTKSSELCGTAASIRGSSTSSRRRFFCWNGRRCSCGTGGCSGGVARNRALEGPSSFNIPDGLAVVAGEGRRREEAARRSASMDVGGEALLGDATQLDRA